MKKQARSKQQKLIDLSNAFLSEEKLTTSDIMRLIDLSTRQSVINYIKELEQEGYQFKHPTKTDNYYTLLAADAYTPISKNILRKYAMLQSLQNGPVKSDQFFHKFTIFSDSNMKNKTFQQSSLTLLDLKQTQFFKYRNELLKEGYIKEEDNFYYLTGDHIPLVLSMNDLDFQSLDELLSNIPAGSPYFSVLQPLLEKIRFMSPSVREELYNHKYFLYGRQNQGLTAIRNQLNKLSKCDCAHTSITISYYEKNGTLRLFENFSLGILIYSVEKDKLYLLGETSEMPNCILISSCIDAIRPGTGENHIYHNEKYNQLYDEMFSISLDPPVDVIVEFDTFGTIPRRIEQLKSHRPSASIIKENDAIIYKDRIRGIDDFANYLRQFGKSARALEPKELRDKMLYSVKRSLTRYQEE